MPSSKISRYCRLSSWYLNILTSDICHPSTEENFARAFRSFAIQANSQLSSVDEQQLKSIFCSVLNHVIHFPVLSMTWCHSTASRTIFSTIPTCWTLPLQKTKVIVICYSRKYLVTITSFSRLYHNTYFICCGKIFFLTESKPHSKPSNKHYCRGCTRFDINCLLLFSLVNIAERCVRPYVCVIV